MRFRLTMKAISLIFVLLFCIRGEGSSTLSFSAGDFCDSPCPNFAVGIAGSFLFSLTEADTAPIEALGGFNVNSDHWMSILPSSLTKDGLLLDIAPIFLSPDLFLLSGVFEFVDIRSASNLCLYNASSCEFFPFPTGGPNGPSSIASSSSLIVLWGTITEWVDLEGTPTSWLEGIALINPNTFSIVPLANPFQTPLTFLEISYDSSLIATANGLSLASLQLAYFPVASGGWVVLPLPAALLPCLDYFSLADLTMFRKMIIITVSYQIIPSASQCAPVDEKDWTQGLWVFVTARPPASTSWVFHPIDPQIQLGKLVSASDHFASASKHMLTLFNADLTYQVIASYNVSDFDV